MTRATPVPAAHLRRPRRGFSLIELIVAVILIAMIAGATSIAVSQALRAKASSEARQLAFSRAGSAVARVAVDLGNALRSGNLEQSMVRVTGSEAGGRRRSGVLVVARNATPVRPTLSQPDGGTAEFQYRVQDDPAPAPTVAPGSGAGILWRRVDPVPDENPDGGGVAFPVVDGIVAFEVDAFDGSAWISSWESDRDGYPRALRVTVTAVGDRPGVTATAQKVVALDRVPLPYKSLNSTPSPTTTR
ncbi:MAG: prepilin-type N-terminal cleavage/methylation domain-containing protein [Phycisphaerales bacterium]|nr:prepilin-type N-terminal cleavage/methylation domain-containing protein [Phycisphaerales bacterium]